MGLTHSSTGTVNYEEHLIIEKRTKNDKVIALAGNPNVGKSTVFNALTGMKQHTGNWPGKTVTNAQGYCKSENNSYVIVDIPGTYSLLAHSAEEEIARNFICFENPDAVVIVCDATCLERNLNLVLQIAECSKNVVICLNLMDEAKRKGINVNTNKLSELLGLPVVPIIARKKKGLDDILSTVDYLLSKEDNSSYIIKYDENIEASINNLMPYLESYKNINTRWLSLKLLEENDDLILELNKFFDNKLISDFKLSSAIEKEKSRLFSLGITDESLKDIIAHKIISEAEKISQKVIDFNDKQYDKFDKKTDKILTSKAFGYPVMIFLLIFIFWLTISGANYPSELLSYAFSEFGILLTDIFDFFNAPEWLHGILISGVYRVVSWVVAVMLPPMAIFFPLFTILEDLGYLPRIAYNLDKPFAKCNACGKQALTMCMGFGCNAAGVVGCKIIDSPRERLLAILTNSFVPCNGRFPILISVITMFFVSQNKFSSVTSALLLTAIILVGIGATFVITSILSKTLLKGVASSFTLELPPYRRPQFGDVIVRSIFDRTLFVLKRAVAVAAPVGLIIWLMANIKIYDISILKHCANFLDPFAQIMGLDGVILIAFILGLPANEIVIPIALMIYLSQGTLVEMSNLMEMKELLTNNGWTLLTAINVMVFTIFHSPCSTTLQTIKKETNSIKWTVFSAVLPTSIGILICICFNLIYMLITHLSQVII